ncbi:MULTISPECIES: hypothetical protein [Planomicrobium]|uniref:hypothetical protein n=1 Tax=Planomicrobium TaxID=162291 RepID=UPI000C7D69E0|nr:MULTISPECIES: hypothetical protein [Planomicrobium]PKH08343.1 hypothetical protein CXF70_17350 [Planomicrobium sp. MB-3u-38]
MPLQVLKSEKAAAYPVSIIFFLSALIVMSHAAALYAQHYKIYDGLENMHRHATIQLLAEIEKNKIPE